MSDLFLEKGIIVTTESRGLEVDRREASLIDTIADVPMIVLVDGGSASASEIVAGALKDHKRAIILGTRTFGKGSVQNIVELEDGGALKLTIAHYFTPSGNSIQAAGIDPDIIVPRNRPTTKRRVVRESDLAGHLEVKSSRKSESKTRLDDYQKQVALDYLKSWAVFRKQ